MEWHFQLDLKKPMQEYDKDEDFDALKSGVKSKLNELHTAVKESFFYEGQAETLANIISLFDLASDVEEFDDAMEALYDWGDTAITRNKSLCWIDLGVGYGK